MSDQRAAGTFFASAAGVIIGICVCVGLLFVAVCGGCLLVGSAVTRAAKDIERQQTTQPAVSNKKPAEPKPIFSSPTAVITSEEFSRIQNGMSYSQVKDIVGADGELSVDSNIAGITGRIYAWKNPDFSNATVQFQDDKVVTKAQFGLR